MLSRPKIYISLITSLLIFIAATSEAPPSLIIELFRHGARGPNDAVWDPSWDPDYVDELTPVGMRAHYILGKVFRKEYTDRYGPDYLMTDYSNDRIYVRSSNVNRTIMSAYAHLYGIFEGNGAPFSSILDSEGVWPPYNNVSELESISQSLRHSPALPLQFLPIPMHMTDVDYIIQGEDNCINMHNWKVINEDSEEYLLMISRFSDTLETFSKLGYQLTNWNLINDFADTVISNHYQNKTLPGNFTWDSEIIKNITFMYNWGTVFTQFGQVIQHQVLSAPLLNYILSHVEASINGSSKLQIMLLSAHDDTLLSFLTPLHVVTPDCIYENYLLDRENATSSNLICQYPTFASSIRIEVFNTSEPYLKITYNGYPLYICNGSDCTYQQFRDLVRVATNNYTLQDYMNICADNSSSASGLLEGRAPVLLTIVIALVIMNIICLLIYHKKDRKGERGLLYKEIYSV